MAKKGTTREASNKQETRLQKKLGGWRPPNSGATPFLKGDVMLDDFYLDGKTSMEVVKSKSIKREELDKAKAEAHFMRKEFYALVLCFGDTKDFYVMEDNDLQTLYEGYQKYKKVLELVGDLDATVMDNNYSLALKNALR